jgi:hypothetical protein
MDQSNNRIQRSPVSNQSCASDSVLESLLPVDPSEIVFHQPARGINLTFGSASVMSTGRLRAAFCFVRPLSGGGWRDSLSAMGTLLRAGCDVLREQAPGTHGLVPASEDRSSTEWRDCVQGTCGRRFVKEVGGSRWRLRTDASAVADEGRVLGSLCDEPHEWTLALAGADRSTNSNAFARLSVVAGCCGMGCLAVGLARPQRVRPSAPKLEILTSASAHYGCVTFDGDIPFSNQPARRVTDFLQARRSQESPPWTVLWTVLSRSLPDSSSSIYY